MSTNVLHLPPPPIAAADQREPLETAVRELSARVRSLNGEHRRLHSRMGELRSADPSLRRRRARTLPADLLRPVTFFSIEEADEEPQTRQVRSA
ncbi:MAG TPA: hypothetical protein VE713_16340 [Pyrinomonadaceae bacterium]|nr:hypothetical protein [Pyrinomonadaceae bacterium]